uniref:Noggin n=1 Tax=Sparus aurata TaxID=8175 RepID=A0A671XX36_SPAAU
CKYKQLPVTVFMSCITIMYNVRNIFDISPSCPMHPYTLLTDPEDYHYMPKPRHRRPSRLLRLLGSSFDPFWMSIEQPSEASKGHDDGQPLLRGDTLPAKIPEYTTAKESLVRDWFVRSATCGLTYQWVDAGPVLWPRWLRHTDCEKSDGERSCSFPGGMECVPAETTYINILIWLCLEVGDGGEGSRGNKADRPDGSTEMGTGEVIKGAHGRKCLTLWSRHVHVHVNEC